MTADLISLYTSSLKGNHEIVADNMVWLNDLHKEFMNEISTATLTAT